jgi:hypothetical protein
VGAVTVTMWLMVAVMGLVGPLLTRPRWSRRDWARYVALMAIWPLSAPYAVFDLWRREGRNSVLAVVWGWRVLSIMSVPERHWKGRSDVR